MSALNETPNPNPLLNPDICRDHLCDIFGALWVFYICNEPLLSDYFGGGFASLGECVVHYYKKNIGDYAKKAGRLSILQHGIYNLLIDACYDRERFPALEDAIDWTWAGTTEEIEAVKFVLSKFFTLEDGLYVQARIQEEIAEYHQFRDQQAAKGKLGGRPKNKADPLADKPGGFNLEASGKPAASQRGQNKSLTTNQEPLTTTKPTAPPKAAPCPTQKIIDLFPEHCPSLIQPRVITGSVKDMIADRWRQDAKHQELEFWVKFFDYCESLDFLTGRTSPTRGEKAFRVGIEWIVKAGNFAKIINGNYVNG